MQAASKPAKTLSRFPKGIFANFVQTCRAGRTDTAVPFGMLDDPGSPD